MLTDIILRAFMAVDTLPDDSTQMEKTVRFVDSFIEEEAEKRKEMTRRIIYLQESMEAIYNNYLPNPQIKIELEEEVENLEDKIDIAREFSNCLYVEKLNLIHMDGTRG